MDRQLDGWEIAEASWMPIIKDEFPWVSQGVCHQMRKFNCVNKKILNMRPIAVFVLFIICNLSFAQQTQVIEYGYNLRGELHMIILDNDTLINFYDASGNRITESQNIYAIDDPSDPEGDHFLSCYPNPTGNEVTIAFELQGEMDYKISLYNQKGQFQQQIAAESRATGKKEINVSLGNQAVGIYYVWFTSKEISKVKKIVRK